MGAGAAVLVTGLLRSLTVAGVVLTLATVSAAATIVPARRAARVGPDADAACRLSRRERCDCATAAAPVLVGRQPPPATLVSCVRSGHRALLRGGDVPGPGLARSTVTRPIPGPARAVDHGARVAEDNELYARPTEHASPKTTNSTLGRRTPSRSPRFGAPRVSGLTSAFQTPRIVRAW